MRRALLVATLLPTLAYGQTAQHRWEKISGPYKTTTGQCGPSAPAVSISAAAMKLNDLACTIQEKSWDTAKTTWNITLLCRAPGKEVTYRGQIQAIGDESIYIDLTADRREAPTIGVFFDRCGS